MTVDLVDLSAVELEGDEENKNKLSGVTAWGATMTVPGCLANGRETFWYLHPEFG